MFAMGSSLNTVHHACCVEISYCLKSSHTCRNPPDYVTWSQHINWPAYKHINSSHDRHHPMPAFGDGE